MVTSGEHERFL